MARFGLVIVCFLVGFSTLFSGCSKIRESGTTVTPASSPASTPTPPPGTNQPAAARELPTKLKQCWDFTKQGKNNEAISCFNDLSKADSKNYNVFAGLGAVYLNTGNLQKADENVHKALSLNSSDPNLHILMGNLRMRENRPDDARIEFSAVVANNPQSSVKSDALVGLGNTYLAVNQPDEAKKQYSQAIEVNPSSSTAYVGMGYVYQRQGDKEKAIEAFEKALSLDSSLPNADQIRKTLQQLKGQ